MKNQRNEQLEKLYCEMYEWLFGYANATLSDPSWAEEVVQETFRIACDKSSVLLESDNPKGWLVNTLKGVLRNFVRKAARDSKVFVPLQEEFDQERPQELPPDLLYQDLARTREYELLKELSEGRSIRELAQRRGISEDTCKKRIQRSRTYLKKRIIK